MLKDEATIYRVTVMPGRETTVKANGLGEEKPAGAVILGHGMNNDLDHALLERTAEALAARGIGAIRFNFLYREAGLEQADEAETLLNAMRAVYRDALTRWKLSPESIFLGGKSLGARIAARAVGLGLEVGGLVYLGFPLHPPGRPDQERVDLLIKVGPKPQLFIVGTRDHLCSPERIKAAMPQLHGEATLQIIEGGDHSFAPAPGDARSEEEIFGAIAEMTANWVKARLT